MHSKQRLITRFPIECEKVDILIRGWTFSRYNSQGKISCLISLRSYSFLYGSKQSCSHSRGGVYLSMSRERNASVLMWSHPLLYLQAEWNDTLHCFIFKSARLFSFLICPAVRDPLLLETGYKLGATWTQKKCKTCSGSLYSPSLRCRICYQPTNLNHKILSQWISQFQWDHSLLALHSL